MTGPVKRGQSRWGIVQLSEIVSTIEFTLYLAMFVLFIISLIFWR